MSLLKFTISILKIYGTYHLWNTSDIMKIDKKGSDNSIKSCFICMVSLIKKSNLININRLIKMCLEYI